MLAFRAGRRVGSDVFLLPSRHCSCTRGHAGQDHTEGSMPSRLSLPLRPGRTHGVLLTGSRGTGEREAVEGRG